MRDIDGGEGRALFPVRASRCAARVWRAGAALLLFLAGGTEGAAIVWNGAGTVAGEAEIITNGALVYAYGFATNAVTVNGVTFAAGGSYATLGGGDITLSGFYALSHAYGSASSPFSDLGAGYQQLLGSGVYDAATPGVVRLNRLTVGRRYRVQVWVSDSRAGTVASRREAIGSAGGCTAKLDYNSTGGAGGVGQYILGGFTADDTNQTFTLMPMAPAGSFSSQLNAIQLRAVPAETEPAHPILSISGSGSGAAAVTNIDEAYYLDSFIPRGPPRNPYFGFAPAVVSNDTGWSWSTSTPNQVKSTPSGTVFPNTNAVRYPVMTQSVAVCSSTVPNNVTRTMAVPYYKQAGSSGKSLVQTVIDYHKGLQLRSDLDKLAQAYKNSGSSPATRNNAYARRIAVALLEWARWHPGYYLTAWNSPSFVNVTSNFVLSAADFNTERASEGNGMMSEWDDSELKAFDVIYQSVALTNLSAELGYDARAYIERNLFFDEGDYLVYHVPPEVAIMSNLSGPYQVLPLVARVLNRPDYIEWMDRYLHAVVGLNLRRDGTYPEGMGYSLMYLEANETAAQNTLNYFATRPAGDPQMLAISNRAAFFKNFLLYGQDQWSTVALPDGMLPSFGDTQFSSAVAGRDAGASGLLPAYGTVSLGGGSGSRAVQLNQNFAGNENHMRADVTAFVLWAFDQELLGNIRYYHQAGRQFCEQILSHNAVTIDRVNETPYPSTATYGNGDLTMYEPGNHGFALTEIDGQRGYAGKASRYQRIMMLNTVDLARPYAVDVMRVTGGTNHDYTLHGAILFDQTWECSLPLVTNTAAYPMLEPGETWSEPTDEYDAFPYYGLWRGVCSNAAPGDFHITYRDKDRSQGRDLRLWMTDGGPTRVHVGMTPNPGRVAANSTPSWYSYWRPSTIVRRRATGLLSDLFVSVLEPLDHGSNTIASVTRLPMNGTTNESVGLRIAFADGRVDTCLVNLRSPVVEGASGGSTTVATADGQYALTGRIGVEVNRPAGDSRVWSMNASEFRRGRQSLATPAGISYWGQIAGETRKAAGDDRDAFTTTTPVPTGAVLRGEWMRLDFGGLSSGETGLREMFQIDQVLYSNGVYRLCLSNDHFLEIADGTNSTEQMWPFRTFTTRNYFGIVLSAAAQPMTSLADQVLPQGGRSGPLPFTVGTLGGQAAGALQVAASSTNQTLLPNGNLSLGGGGSNRTITVTPASHVTGRSLVTVAVTDGVWTNRQTFTVVVSNFPPPQLIAPASSSVIAGAHLALTNRASDATAPTQQLAFSLRAAPAGATIDPLTGLVHWRPAVAQAGTSHLFTVVVAQSGWATNLPSLDDAYVRNGSYAASNYGDSAVLGVKQGSSGLSRESFLTFSLAGIPGTIVDAALGLTATTVSTAGTHAVARVLDDSWTEAGLTWNNKPASGPALAAWVPELGETVSAPVLDAVRDAVTNGRPLVSLRVYATNTTADGLVYYGSKEGGAAAAPRLAVVSTPGVSLSATQSFWVTVQAPQKPVLAGVYPVDGPFRLVVDGSAGPDYTIQGTTNMQPGSWATLFSTNSPAVPFTWVDSHSSGLAHRVYRVLLGP